MLISHHMNSNGQLMLSSSIWVFIQQQRFHIMMRENHITKSCKYIIIYQNELYIVSTILEEILQIVQDKHKIKINPDVHLGSNFPHDPGGTMIC